MFPRLVMIVMEIGLGVIKGVCRPQRLGYCRTKLLPSIDKSSSTVKTRGLFRQLDSAWVTILGLCHLQNFGTIVHTQCSLVSPIFFNIHLLFAHFVCPSSRSFVIFMNSCFTKLSAFAQIYTQEKKSSFHSKAFFLFPPGEFNQSLWWAHETSPLFIRMFVSLNVFQSWSSWLWNKDLVCQTGTCFGHVDIPDGW